MTAPIAPGTRLGPYEIVAQIGAGGMGLVFKAKDFQLGRAVALKVLPEGFTADPERVARFEREARLLATLNHPNIAQIYGLEQSGGTKALVMELVEGPTLADRLAQGALPIDESLAIARQIAEALEEAHERGIVHRDLKPQNIKAAIEGKVKVLDFGLAKAMDPTASAPGVPGAGGAGTGAVVANSPTLMNSPTLSAMGATQLGVILGTAGYMAPEQARGGTVDKRADVWAFGVVLWEMLVGRRLFEGETVSDTLAGVLRQPIDLDALPAATPVAVRRLVARCLERDPRRRLRDIGEARVVLSDPGALAPAAPAPAAPGEPASRGRTRVWAAALAVLAPLLVLLGWELAGKLAPAPARPLFRSHLVAPAGSQFNAGDGAAALSPDGRSVVLRVEDGGETTSGLAILRFDTHELRRLPGSAGNAYDPFWSPDGREIGFFSRGLEKIDATGLSTPQILAPIIDARGGAWSRDGVVLFAPKPAGPLLRVDAAGGEPVAATTLDPGRSEIAHSRPQFLPDGKRFLYLVRSERPEHSGIYVGELGGPLKKRVLAIDVAVRYAPPGALLSVQGGVLVARRFDLERLEVVGEPVEIAREVEYVPQFDVLPVSASEDGRLAYHPLREVQTGQLVRVDRTGRSLGAIGDTGDFNLDLSPDGSRLASTRFDPRRRLLTLWIHDLVRGVRSRVEAATAVDGAVWSPDGRRIAYIEESATARRIVVRPATGGPVEATWSDPATFVEEPVDWSPDGRWLLVESGSPDERVNLLLAPADGNGRAVPFAKSAAREHSGRFSPDGRFVAYISDQTGREEVYLERMPQTGEIWLVSPNGGVAPRWSSDARELFYVEPASRGEEQLRSVTLTERDGAVELSPPRELATLPSSDYEPLPGGREFLVAAPTNEASSAPLMLIDNWPALLGER